MAIEVNVDNFARAEVASQVERFLGFGAGVNDWTHIRRPTPLDQQSVIRMNRDTLYSVAVVDAAAGVTVTLPDAGGRYLTVMVMDEDGYVARVLHDPGVQQLTADEVGGGFAVLIARILVDPTDPEDVAEVNRLQDLLVIDARVGPAVAERAVRRGELPGDEEAAAGTRTGPARLAPDVRHEGLGRSGALPDRHRRRLRRAARGGGVLRHPGHAPAGGHVPAAGGGRAGRRVLVGVGLQPRRVLRREPVRLLQRQQRDGGGGRRWRRHRPLRSRTRRVAQLPLRQGRVELRRPHVPADGRRSSTGPGAFRSPRRCSRPDGRAGTARDPMRRVGGTGRSDRSVRPVGGRPGTRVPARAGRRCRQPSHRRAHPRRGWSGSRR